MKRRSFIKMLGGVAAALGMTQIPHAKEVPGDGTPMATGRTGAGTITNHRSVGIVHPRAYEEVQSMQGHLGVNLTCSIPYDHVSFPSFGQLEHRCSYCGHRTMIPILAGRTKLPSGINFNCTECGSYQRT